MLRELVVLAIVGCALSQEPATHTGSLDDLINTIFNDMATTQDILDDQRDKPKPKPTQQPITTTIRTTGRPPISITTARTTTGRPTARTTISTTTFRPDPIDPIDGVNPCSAGECTPYYLCPNGTIITDGEGILDVRLGADDDPEPERHPCPQFFDTCCLVKGEEPIIKPVVRKEGCGWRNHKGVGFQIKERSNEAQFAEFPWTTAIMVKQVTLDQTLNIYQCAGALIHPEVVLTAAHCVADKQLSGLVIRAGEWDTQTKDEPFPHQDRQVHEVIIHEHFKKSNLFNDIALLILKEPVKLVENVNTACLPPPDTIFHNKRCIATGWGKDKFGRQGAYQAILKKVELPVVTNHKCQEALRKTRLGKHFKLDTSFMCAGGEPGVDTCTGDGGAPLVCEVPSHEGRYYEVGMVSWGIGCNEGHPGVYVNVPSFIHWIDKQFERKKLDTSFYTFTSYDEIIKA